MHHAGCAAVVVRSGKNFTYLAGFAYPGTSPGIWIFLIPPEKCSCSGHAMESP